VAAIDKWSYAEVVPDNEMNKDLAIVCCSSQVDLALQQEPPKPPKRVVKPRVSYERPSKVAEKAAV
jgi:hypothetical protein